MATTLRFTSDRANNASFASVLSGEGYWAKDLDDSLSASTAYRAFLDGSFWTIPAGMSGGTGDDNYSVGYDSAAIIADAGFGRDSLRIYRNLNDATWAARIDGRHLAAMFEAFPGSQYTSQIFIVDAFKPEGSIETTTFSDNVILNTAYDKLASLIASAGIPFEDLSWEQAIAKKYVNLSVIGVPNNSAGAAELIDLVYKAGNPVTQAGVHRFFNPSKGVHFYSNDLNEVNAVRSRLGTYQYEGKVYDPVTGSNGTQLYRFFNAKASYHFMTTSATEAAVVSSNPSWGYAEEGRSFTVSTQAAADATTPVYRFFRIVSGVGQHFYTSSEAERQNILANPGWGYQAEGVGWYAQ